MNGLLEFKVGLIRVAVTISQLCGAWHARRWAENVGHLEWMNPKHRSDLMLLKAALPVFPNCSGLGAIFNAGAADGNSVQFDQGIFVNKRGRLASKHGHRSSSRCGGHWRREGVHPFRRNHHSCPSMLVGRSDSVKAKVACKRSNHLAIQTRPKVWVGGWLSKKFKKMPDCRVFDRATGLEVIRR